MWRSSDSSKWSNYGNGPGRLNLVKITGFCSASDRVGYVWTRECSKQRTTKLLQIEDSAKKDKQELMNCLFTKRGILRLWVNYWLKFRWFKEQSKFLDAREFDDPETGSSSGATHVPSDPPLFWVPGPCLAAILECRVIHKIVRVQQETFLNDHVLKKDYHLRSSTFKEFGILLSGIEAWHYRNNKENREWKENRWVRRLLHTTSKVEVACWILLVELISTMVWWIIREFLLRIRILENFLTQWNFKAGKSTSGLRFV